MLSKHLIVLHSLFYFLWSQENLTSRKAGGSVGKINTFSNVSKITNSGENPGNHRRGVSTGEVSRLAWGSLPQQTASERRTVSMEGLWGPWAFQRTLVRDSLCSGIKLLFPTRPFQGIWWSAVGDLEPIMDLKWTDVTVVHTTRGRGLRGSCQNHREHENRRESFTLWF